MATLASRGQLRLRCSACRHEWRPEANEILAAFGLPLFTLADRIAQGYERRARRPLPYRGVLLTPVPTLASRYLAPLLTFDVTPLLLYDLRNLLPGAPRPRLAPGSRSSVSAGRTRGAGASATALASTPGRSGRSPPAAGKGGPRSSMKGGAPCT